MEKLLLVAVLLQPSAGVAVVRHAPVTMMGTRPRKSVAVNRLARRNYEILDEFEAGVALVGTEVKSCRAGKVTLRDGYCRVKDGECWLENVHIAQHGTTGSYFQHDEVRPRRLLLHKREIVKLKSQVDRQGLTIVPMACYFNEQSRLKVNIALARGKNVADKRETIRRRESDRENRRMLKVTMSAAAAAPDAAAPPHVVFLQNFGQGHVLPTVPLVAALRAKGCAVTYFAESDGPHGDDLVNEHTMLGKAVVAAGATLRAYADFDPDLDPDLEPRLDGFLNKRWRKLPGLLADLRALEPPPAVVVYDPFVGMFPAAATVLGLPHVSLVPHSGPGSMASVETPKKLEQAAGVRDWLNETHGVDLLDLGLPAISWCGESRPPFLPFPRIAPSSPPPLPLRYSRYLNLVCTTNEFFAPMCTEAQRRLWTADHFRCVGTLNEAARSCRPADAKHADGGFALDEVRAARDAGKRVVLLSLGSVVTGYFFDAPLGRAIPSHIAANTGGDDERADGKSLAEMTGKDFVHFVFRRAFAAFGGRDDVFVVLACGKGGAEKVFGGLDVELPPNFMACGVVPQLDVLPLCDAFVTHGGMGSVMEALLHRVPLAVIPVFGDQIWNADRAGAAGLGVSFRYPLRTLTADALAEATAALCDAGEGNPYRRAVDEAADAMEREGGAARAAELVLDLVENPVRYK